MQKDQNRVYRHYKTISQFYKGKKTSKNIPYINHIDEGVGYLELMGVSDTVVNAFILHPFVQCVNLKGTYNKTLLTKSELEEYVDIFELEPDVAYELLLYRKYANSYLCRPDTDGAAIMEAYSLIDTLQNHQTTVRMLIADKLQNFKDFIKYREDHERAKHLTQYFIYWLSILHNIVDSNSIRNMISKELSVISGNRYTIRGI